MKEYQSSELSTAFLLGFQLEEVYSIFGESLFRVFEVASNDYIKAFDHKFILIEKCIEDLNLAIEFTALSAYIRQNISLMSSTNWSNADEMKNRFDIARSISNRLDHIMNNVSTKLNSIDKTRFDLGIFVARISLCCRVIKMNEPAKNELYLTELKRVKEHFIGTLQKATDDGIMEAAFLSSFRRRLDGIVVELKSPELHTPRVLASLHTQIELLLDDMGFNLKSANL